MSSNADQEVALLTEVRRRRAELRVAMGELERALAAPAGPGAVSAWVAGLHAALAGLYEDFTHHVEVTEGPDGLYAELARHSPRLAHAVLRLTEEHADVRRRLEELLTWADVGNEDASVPQARAAATDLLVVLMRHRQRGADLMFEAFHVDIGGET